jgi:hypothetical protein
MNIAMERGRVSDVFNDEGLIYTRNNTTARRIGTFALILNAL